MGVNGLCRVSLSFGYSILPFCMLYCKRAVKGKKHSQLGSASTLLRKLFLDFFDSIIITVKIAFII